MYLRVSADSARRGAMVYTVGACVPHSRKTKNGWPPKKKRARVIAQAPRIEKMARRTLGSSFISLERVPNIGTLFLKVKTGTSRGEKRFELRELLGWIALCAME